MWKGFKSIRPAALIYSRFFSANTVFKTGGIICDKSVMEIAKHTGIKRLVFTYAVPRHHNWFISCALKPPILPIMHPILKLENVLFHFPKMGHFCMGRRLPTRKTLRLFLHWLLNFDFVSKLSLKKIEFPHVFYFMLIMSALISQKKRILCQKVIKNHHPEGILRHAWAQAVKQISD